MDSKKYTPTWSFAAEQDLRAVYNIEAADHLAEMMTQEITNEINKEILADLAFIGFPEQWKKKKLFPRSIDSDWEVSRFD